jgi:hypothetical protein
VALDFRALVDRALGQFDTTQATVESFVNERQGRMVSEAEYLLEVKSLGSTVSGTSTYNLDADLVDLRYIQVGSGRYDLTSLRDIWELQAGREGLSGSGSVFAPTYDSSGNRQIVLYPTPTTTGDVITGIEALHPSDGTYAANTALVIPKHLRPHLLDGVIADCYEQIDERWDMAQPHEQRYEDGIDKLRRLKNTRVGSGPAKIQLTRA